MCLHIVEKYEKVESINTQNDYKTTSKKWANQKKKTCSVSFAEVFKFQKKQIQDCLKESLGNNDKWDPLST